MVGSELGSADMKALILPTLSMVHAGGDVKVWCRFSCHTFGVEHCVNTAYLSNVANNVHPFMTTLYQPLIAAPAMSQRSNQTGFFTELGSWQ